MQDNNLVYNTLVTNAKLLRKTCVERILWVLYVQQIVDDGRFTRWPRTDDQNDRLRSDFSRWNQHTGVEIAPSNITCSSIQRLVCACACVEMTGSSVIPKLQTVPDRTLILNLNLTLALALSLTPIFTCKLAQLSNSTVSKHLFQSYGPTN